jgi:hypothetical protein
MSVSSCPMQPGLGESAGARPCSSGSAASACPSDPRPPARPSAARRTLGLARPGARSARPALSLAAGPSACPPGPRPAGVRISTVWPLPSVDSSGTSRPPTLATASACPADLRAARVLPQPGLTPASSLAGGLGPWLWRRRLRPGRLGLGRRSWWRTGLPMRRPGRPTAPPGLPRGAAQPWADCR